MKLTKFVFLIILSTFFYQGDLIANNNNVLVDKISKNLRCLICQGQKKKNKRRKLRKTNL